MTTEEHYKQHIALLTKNVERKEQRIADLESSLKTLLPSWPDGYEYLSEMSLLQMHQRRIAELEKAAKAVCDYDWSDNDEDAVRAVEKLRGVLNRRAAFQR